MIPANGTERLRPDLGVLVHEAMSNAPSMGFVASEVAPYFPVGAQSADYPVLPAKYLFNVEDVARAHGAAYKRSSGKFEAGHYSCRERGHEYPLDDRFKAIYKSQIDMEKGATDMCVNIVLRAYEVEVAKKVTRPTNFLTGAAIAPWTDYENADPRRDRDNAVNAARKKGIVLNTLILTWNNYQDLTRCKRVQEAVHYIFPDTKKTGTIGLQHLEAYLDIKILLAGALKNGSNRAKNPDFIDIWPDNVATFACVASPGASIEEPSIARTFRWNEGSSEEYVVEDYYSNEVRSQVIRVRHDIDVRLLKSYDDDGNVKSDISKNCGYVLTGIR
ncbi:hypothetical protein [Maridesulfovibrio sp.]|uniref:hypothetical protein n=1 Tax=Maridesulfovibrio sp. TaxID=2795000 RepID=UPI003AFFC622